MMHEVIKVKLELQRSHKEVGDVQNLEWKSTGVKQSQPIWMGLPKHYGARV